MSPHTRETDEPDFPVAFITRKKLHPHHFGARRNLERFGNDLVCISHRYDSGLKRSRITVEFVVNESDWMKNVKRIAPHKKLKVKIRYGEIKLGSLMRSAGGEWNAGEKVWEVACSDVKSLGLKNRIVFVFQYCEIKFPDAGRSIKIFCIGNIIPDIGEH